MKTKSIRHILFFILAFVFTDAFAQHEFVMTTNSHQSAVSDSCHVYDDGGKNSPHATWVKNAEYTVTSTNPNARFRIISDVKINNNSYKAKVEIIDGDENSTDILETFSGTVKKRFYSTTNKVTIRFNADDDAPLDGFDILLIACACEEPENIVCESLSETSVKLSWDSPYDNMTWRVDYVSNCAPSLTKNCLGDLSQVQTIYTTDNYVIITDLTNYGKYVAYDIYGTCGTITACGLLDKEENKCPDILPIVTMYDTADKTVTVMWEEPEEGMTWYCQTDFLPGETLVINDTKWEYYYGDTCGEFIFMIATGKDNTEPIWCDKDIVLIHIPCPCNAIVPDDIDISVEYENDSVVFTWQEDSEDIIWYIRVVEPESLSVQDTLTTPKYKIPISCSMKVSLMVTGDTMDSEDIWCDYLFAEKYINYPCQDITYIHATEVTAHTLTVAWNMSDESITSFIVECYDAEGTLVYYDTVQDDHFVTITGLDNYAKYTCVVKSICPDGRSTCGVKESFYTAYDDCLNFVNLFSDKVTLREGTYDDPYASAGSAWNNSRYLVCSGENVKDILTGMNVVPAGEKASVRLGNNSVGRQAESIAYDYTVDTSLYDMLVLQYAVVLEDPDHDQTNQPRFTLEILDDEGNLIDNTCGYVDFYAAGDLGWNKVSETSNVIWKDWSTLGIDIAPYQGKEIKIRFTTYDCNDGGHFGYAYYNITCAKKKVDVFNTCTTEDSVTLAAPNGFYYSWYKENTTDTISHDREIVVPVDNSQYYCLLSFIGKTECSFLLSASAIKISPKASYEYYIDTCFNQIHFLNTSYLDYDQTLGVIPSQTIDSVYWILDNGEIYKGKEFVYTYTTNENFHLKMLITLSNSLCSDSLDIDMNIDFSVIGEIYGSDEVCEGDNLTLGVKSNLADAEYVWNNGQSGEQITFIPTYEDSLYYVRIYSEGECKGSAYWNVKIHKKYDDTVWATICQDEYYTDYGFSENTAGTYVHNEHTYFGCDSITTLILNVLPSHYDTMTVISCNGGYYSDGFAADSSGIYVQTFQTMEGCDSVVVLDFTLIEPFSDTVHTQIYQGMTYRDDNFEESESGTYEKVYTDINGCDSVYVLDLDVLQLKFPNTVTPNGDGINDVFEIYGILDAEIFDDMTLIVFNRYGKQIFKQTQFKSKEDFWNPASTNTPTGTYFYRFIARSKQKNIELTGVIEVLL